MYEHRKDKYPQLTQLHKALDRLGYGVSYSLIEKIEAGDRQPGGEFVFYFSQLLGLSEKELSDLVEAWRGERDAEFWREYQHAEETHRERLRSGQR